MDHPPSTEKTGPRAGDVIDGKLEIEGVIAEGRTSTVVSAIDRDTREKVAVKILRSSDLESVERFRRAARGMAKLTSPHVVKVLRVGETHDGSPCMSMEYLEGKTLAQKLLQSGPLPISDATRWMLEACEAVAHAHAHKLLHRDLDAENLYLAMPKVGAGGAPSIRVLDFGLAPVWRLGKGDGRLKPGEVPGTSYAMAPELARGSDLDERVDVWGVGACLYRLLTNRYPFSARNLAELCSRVLAERTPDVTKARPEVTPALAAVVKRCLEREPSDRYASIKDVIAALEEARDDSPNTPNVPTGNATLEELRATPMMLRAASAMTDSADDLADDQTSVFGLSTPITVRTVPVFEELAKQLEPAKQSEGAKLPKTNPPPRREPTIEDGPSTQPLGRLSPFAELPKPKPKPVPEPTTGAPASDEEHTVGPILSPMLPMLSPMLSPITEPFGGAPKAAAPAPLPKPSPAMMAQDTVQGPAPALPRPTPAVMDAETLPRGLAPAPSPAEPLTPEPAPLFFQGGVRALELIPTPTPSAPVMPSMPSRPQFSEPPPAQAIAREGAPPKKRSGLVVLVFAIGILGSIAVGLYVARATLPTTKVEPKPSPTVTTPTSAAPAAATISDTVDVAASPSSSASASALADPVETTTASASAPNPSSTHRHRRPPPPPPSSASAGAPKPSIYDPGVE